MFDSGANLIKLTVVDRDNTYVAVGDSGQGMFPKETDSWRTSRCTFSQQSVVITPAGLFLWEWTLAAVLQSRACKLFLCFSQWQWMDIGLCLYPPFSLLSCKSLLMVNVKAPIPCQRIFWRNPGMLRITSGFLVAWAAEGTMELQWYLTGFFLRRLRCPLSCSLLKFLVSQENWS